MNSMIQRMRRFFINRKAAIKAVPTLSPEECNQTIAKMIQTNAPALIGRIGWVEGYCTGKLLLEGKLSEKEQKILQETLTMLLMGTQEVSLTLKADLQIYKMC